MTENKELTNFLKGAYDQAFLDGVQSCYEFLEDIRMGYKKIETHNELVLHGLELSVKGVLDFRERYQKNIASSPN